MLRDHEGASRVPWRFDDPVEPASDAELNDPREEQLGRIVERPDGLHWIAVDGHQEFGPFATVEEALAAMSEAIDDAPEPGETLAEAEQELGIADWFDPETGAPAEDTATRICDN